jgi:hypothetical protein
MVYLASSNIGSERARSSVFKTILQNIATFVSAWAETSAAFTVYRELSGKSNAQLAARGLRREDIGRAAMKLELVRK